MKIIKSETEYIKVERDERFNPDAQPWELKFTEYKYCSVIKGKASAWSGGRSLSELREAAQAQGWRIEE